MKNIITLCLNVFAAPLLIGQIGSAEIRLVETILNERIEVQYKLGPSTKQLPGDGGGAYCTATQASDTLILDLTHALRWDESIELTVTVFSTPVDFVNLDFGSNAAACTGCQFTNNNDGLGPYGGGYGIAAITPGTNAGFNFYTMGIGNMNYCVANGILIPSSDGKWQPNVWYTIAEYDIAVSSSSNGVEETLSLLDIIELDDGTASQQVPNISTFSPQGVNQISAEIVLAGDALPLELLEFNVAKKGDKSADLNWTTANEINTSLFVIQRSEDKITTWRDIGIVAAAGAGSHVGVREYNFVDKNVYSGRKAKGIYYYRLRMVDIDDTFEYSNIEVVSFRNFLSNTDDGFKLYTYPNPATQGVNIEISQDIEEDPITHIELYDVSGKMVYGRDIDYGSTIEYIDFQRLNIISGTYVLLAIDGNNKAKTHEKIVVMR